MGKILIIDDDKTDRLLIKKALLKLKSDLHIIELEDGHKAVATIEDEGPLVTLLDIRMPGMDGFHVLKAIRNTPNISNHVVLMVSGSDEASDKKMADEYGANGYLVKPDSFIGYGDLAQTIYKTVFESL